MGRKPGSKNKPKLELQKLQFQNSPDILKLNEVAELFRVSPQEIRRQLRAKEIPVDCYFKIGPAQKYYRFYKMRLELLTLNKIRESLITEESFNK